MSEQNINWDKIDWSKYGEWRTRNYKLWAEGLKKQETMSQKHPDARMHQIVSFVKSGIRILGYCLIPVNLIAATLVLVVSEAVGIFEEMV